MIAEAVLLAVGGVVVVITVVAGLGALGTRVPRTAGLAETLIGYTKNPLTWIAIYGILVGVPALIRWRLDSGGDDNHMPSAR